MTNIEKMNNGSLYFSNDEELVKEQNACMEILYDFNHTRPSELDKRNELLKKLLSSVGKEVHIEPPFHANWGRHTSIGNNVYINFNLTLSR